MLSRDKDDLGLQHPGALEPFHWGSGCGRKVKSGERASPAAFPSSLSLSSSSSSPENEHQASYLPDRESEGKENDTHTPQGIGTYLGKQIINIKQKTAAQDRHAKGRVRYTNQ